jgi:hypothetical protein
MVKQFCPVPQQFEESRNWTLDTVEYATDVVFQRQGDQQGMYGDWVRTAIHTVKPKDIATFLGKKLNGNYQGEMGNRYNTRIEGTRIRHSMETVSIKMYDKFGQIPRIETTVKDVTFFRHCREVEQRDGNRVAKYAAMKKTIYRLGALRELAAASHRSRKWPDYSTQAGFCPAKPLLAAKSSFPTILPARVRQASSARSEPRRAMAAITARARYA